MWVEGYLTVFIFMSMHGELSEDQIYLFAKWPKALVAMRVYAIYGGPKWLRHVLWVGGVLYAIPTMLILGFGLYEGHRTFLPFPFFSSPNSNSG